jgi:hypothetical protein
MSREPTDPLPQARRIPDSERAGKVLDAIAEYLAAAVDDMSDEEVADDLREAGLQVEGLGRRMRERLEAAAKKRGVTP